MAGEVVGKAVYQTEVDKTGLSAGLAGAERDISRAGATAEDAFGNKGTAAMSKFGSVGQGAVIGIASSVATMGLTAAIGAVTDVVGKFGDAVKLASDKAEAASKAQALFGDSYHIVEEASKGAATSVGLSSGAYLTAAGNLGNLITNFGITGDKAAEMGVDMVGLAADLGSFNNASTVEVTEAMGAAFRGESEPIRRFGVMLDAASVTAQAVKMGLIEVGEALTPAARLQATYALILEQTTKAQGDFARTSTGLANSQRIAAAQQEEAWTKIGDKLQPLVLKVMPMLQGAMLAVVEAIGFVVDAVTEWIDNNQPLLDQIAELARWVGEHLFNYLKLFGALVGEVGYRLGGFIGIIVNTIGALVDFGGALAAVLRGDFDAAVKHAELAGGRLQGLQEDMQRVAGDAGRRAADQQEADAARAVVSATKGYENLNDANRALYDQLTGRSGTATDQVVADTETGTEAVKSFFKEVGESLNDEQVTAALQGMADATGVSLSEMRSLWQQSGVDIASLAGKTAEDAAAAIRAGSEAMIVAAAWGGEQTPRAYSRGINSAQETVFSAFKNLKTLMHDALDPAVEEAKLIGIATSRRLARALADGRPEVRAEAQQIALDTIARLQVLNPKSAEIGRLTTLLMAQALPNERPALQQAINGIVNTVENPLGTLPDIAGRTGTQVGNRLASAIRAMRPIVVDSVDDMVRVVTNRLQLGSPAKEGPWSVDGGPLAWVDRAGRGMTSGLARAMLVDVGTLRGAASAVAQAAVASVTQPRLGLAQGGLGLPLAPGLVAGAGTGSGPLQALLAPQLHLHLHVGTLVADDAGIHQLAGEMERVTRHWTRG